jgi:LysM repeat protein
MDSYIEHSNFLKGSQRYSFLFQLDPTDYKSWAFGLKKAGYATNSKYPQILIKLIEEYNLQQYSLIALGRLSADEEQLAGIKKPGTENSTSPGPLFTEIPMVEEPQGMAVSYPSGEFTINRTRVVFARAGTSLLALAQQYDISYKRLLDFNDLKQEEVLIADQLIFLQRKRKAGSAEFHIVQAGETLYSISQSEGIRLESLLQYNLLKSNMRPATGEKLYLQKESLVQPRLVVENNNLMEPGGVGDRQPVSNQQNNSTLLPGKKSELASGYVKRNNDFVKKIKD